jgi:hypothetical protein
MQVRAFFFCGGYFVTRIKTDAFKNICDLYNGVCRRAARLLLATKYISLSIRKITKR